MSGEKKDPSKPPHPRQSSRSSSPFDAPTLYQPQHPQQHPQQQRPTHNHTPLPSSGSPFDAPTLYQGAHQPQTPPSSGSPFDAPTLYQPQHPQQQHINHTPLPSWDQHNRIQTHQPPSAMQQAYPPPHQGTLPYSYAPPNSNPNEELFLPQEDDLYTGGYEVPVTPSHPYTADYEPHHTNAAHYDQAYMSNTNNQPPPAPYSEHQYPPQHQQQEQYDQQQYYQQQEQAWQQQEQYYQQQDPHAYQQQEPHAYQPSQHTSNPHPNQASAHAHQPHDPHGHNQSPYYSPQHTHHPHDPHAYQPPPNHNQQYDPHSPSYPSTPHPSYHQQEQQWHQEQQWQQEQQWHQEQQWQQDSAHQHAQHGNQYNPNHYGHQEPHDSQQNQHDGHHDPGSYGQPPSSFEDGAHNWHNHQPHSSVSIEQPEPFSYQPQASFASYEVPPPPPEVELDVVVGAESLESIEPARPIDTEDGERNSAQSLVARLREALGDGSPQARPIDTEEAAFPTPILPSQDALELSEQDALALESHIHDEQQRLHSVAQLPADLAQQFWQHLAQGTKQMQLYKHQQNRHPAHYLTSAMASLRLYHAQYDAMTVTVQPFALTLDDTDVYEAHEQDNSLTYKLFTAGIRTLTFEPLIPLRELTTFATILQLSQQELQREDLSSRLWRANLKHIATLQVQSLEVAEEGEENIAELAQLVALLQSQLATNDPRNGVNFRGMDALDLMAGGALMNAETERELGSLPTPPTAEEKQGWQRIRQAEEATLAASSSRLYASLFEHIQHDDQIETLYETIAPICERLLLANDYFHLSVLLDAIEWQTQHHPHTHSQPWKQLLGQVTHQLSRPEPFSLLLAYLQENPNPPGPIAEAISMFIHFLGADVQRSILAHLPTLPRQIRRLLLASLCAAPQAQGLIQTAFSRLHEEADVLVDLLDVLSQTRTKAKAPGKALHLMLQHKHPLVQSKAFLLMAQHNPDEARNTVKTLLTQHDATTRISLLRVLCEQDEEGAYLALTYANSPEFTKLPHDEQQTLFRILGQTKQPAVIDFCAQLLDQKSSMLKPSIERNKRLAMLALGTARTLKAKNLLSKALQDKTNSKKLRQDIHETLKKIWT